MKVQLLHIADCPNTAIAEARTRSALDALSLSTIPNEMVMITTEAEASARFGGSPTILVEGADLFPDDVGALARMPHLRDRERAGPKCVGREDWADRCCEPGYGSPIRSATGG